jgi:hypothetical protein
MKATNILLALSLVLASSLASHAQVGIGTATPEASSVLDLTSTTQGLLVPRMTEAQRLAITTPANGLIVYQTDGSVGLWVYNASTLTWTLSTAAAPDADASTKGKIQLAGDLTGTAASPAIADDAVTTAKIAWEAVTESELAFDAVTTLKIADDAVTTAKIGPEAVTESELAYGAVTTAKIALGAVTEFELAYGAVTTLKIASEAVTEFELASGAVTTAKIAWEAVTESELASEAVTTAKILDANVTYAKVQNVSAPDKVLGRTTAGAGVIEEIATTGSGDVVRAISPVLIFPHVGATGTAGSSHIKTVGTIPTVTGTGLGTGGSIALDAGSTDMAGVITITAGTTAGAVGTVTLTFNSPYETNFPVIILTLVDGTGGVWEASAVARISTQSLTAPVITWNNINADLSTNRAIALTSSSTYSIAYMVIQK